MTTITRAAILAGYEPPSRRTVKSYLDSLRGDKPAFTLGYGNIPVTKPKKYKNNKRESEGHRKAVVYTGFYTNPMPVFKTCYWRKSK